MESIADKIKQRLQALSPVRLIVTDDSGNHAGHAGNPDGKGQTHFIVDIVSEAFAGKSRINRHRMVQDLLKNLWSGTTLHALSIKASTPAETAA